ncbi:MAG TPA: hypothetical protein VK919_06610 [Solirubrobacterales bacterium]|nr:hypothetical protein [Solirubrobacterales bacterium]
MSHRPFDPRDPLARRRQRRRWTLAAAALGAAAGALAFAASADAGSYVVRQCTPSVPGAQANWERTSEHYRGEVRCASGGGLQIRHQAPKTAHGRQGAWAWNAPPGTVFTSVRANASLTRGGGHAGQLRAVPASGAPVLFGGVHDAFRVHSRSDELARFEVRLRCINPSGCSEGPDARARAKGVRLRVADRSAPSAAEPAGSLVADAVVRGPRSVSLTASDRGGGVRRLWIEANGRQLAGRTQDCGALATGFATRLVPCPATATAAFPIATAQGAFATGPNLVSACAKDLALSGAANRACTRRRIWVDNACPASLRLGTRLAAAFAGSRARAAVDSNRRALVTGRLTDEAGGGVARGSVCVLTRTARAGSRVRVAAVRRTDAGGRYAIPLPPGPSRRVFVHHAGADSVVARHGLELRSRVRPALRVRAPRRASTGDRLRFAGRLPGPACSRRSVAIQAQVAKRRWQVFRTARTNRRCRFATAYRLRATSDPVVYRFRVRVGRQPGYPYEPGTSPVRRRRVGG